MTLIYLVRHGRTDLIGKQLCGNLPGIHLNEEGKNQARKAAEYLSAFPIKGIHSSPLERACETAAPLAGRLGLAVEPEEFLRELNFGDYQGKGEDLDTDTLWKQFLSNPAGVKFPHGESVSETRQRVAAGLDALSQKYGSNESIVCVAHCEVLRLAVCEAIQLPDDHLHRLTIEPASISLVECTVDRKTRRMLNYSPA